MPGARRRGGLLLRKLLDRRAGLGHGDVLDGCVLGAARLSASENGERVGRRVEICDTRTRTAFAPRSGGDVGAEKKTTLMLPSSADTMPTFTVIWFSDMISIDFSYL